MVTAPLPEQTHVSDIVSTRDLDGINWMEFQEVIPSKVAELILDVRRKWDLAGL
jgi:hypothetical protein